MRITKANKKLQRRIDWITKDETEDIKKYLTEREISRAHEKYRKKIKKYLPELAQRVFALRKRIYAGCGFHYSMENLLGNTIAGLNSYNKQTAKGEGPFIDDIIVEINVKMLFKTIKEAEKSADEWDREHNNPDK